MLVHLADEVAGRSSWTCGYSLHFPGFIMLPSHCEKGKLQIQEKGCSGRGVSLGIQREAGTHTDGHIPPGKKAAGGKPSVD